MKLGIVTYNIARGWDVPTILDIGGKTGIQGVELRTTHAHGVEVELSAAQRAEVKQQFADGGVEIAGLGSAFEYHALEPEAVRENIDGTIEYAKLAADLGCPGIKVRPNGLQVDKGVPVEKTLEQIGLALRECGQAAADLGVQVRLEVHGRDTCEPRNIRTIMDHADHPNVYICWNSNETDLIDGSLDAAWRLLSSRVGLVHTRDLAAPGYPWLDLVRRLRGLGYEGFCLNEVPESDEPGRIMDYNKALWNAYNRIANLEG